MVNDISNFKDGKLRVCNNKNNNLKYIIDKNLPKSEYKESIKKLLQEMIKINQVIE